MLTKKTRCFLLIASAPVTLLFLLFYMVPLGAMVAASFLQWDGILVEGYAGFANYAKLLSEPVFYLSIRNMTSWVLVAVFVHIPMALTVALILGERLRGWKFLRTAYFIPQIISGVAWAVIFLSVFNNSYGLLNGILRALGLDRHTRNWLFDPSWAWPSIIFTWLFFIGLYSMILLAEIISIPNDIFESAEIDGATKFQQAIYLKIPLLRLVVGTCLILTISGGIKYFDGLYIMTNGAPNYRTETLALYLYQQYTYANYAYANTIGVSLLVFGMIIIFAVMKAMRMNHKVD